jgi:transcriptional regulator with XRE-family HTH domain
MYLRSTLAHCIRSATAENASIISLMHSTYGTADSGYSDTTIYFKDEASKSLTAQIADTVAALRQSQGMSMGEFAGELGASVRQLADIERGRRSTSIELLLRVCRRFRKPIGYFLSSTLLTRPFYLVQRAGDIGRLPVLARRKLVDQGWSKTEFRSLTPELVPRGMYPYYVKLLQPIGHRMTLHEHHGQEFVYVLSGEVTLVTDVDGQRVTEALVAGDCCFIDSTVPHRFVGAGLSPYDASAAEVIDVYWCPLGESYLFDEDRSNERAEEPPVESPHSTLVQTS